MSNVAIRYEESSIVTSPAGQVSIMIRLDCLYDAPEQVRSVGAPQLSDDELEASLLEWRLINPLIGYRDEENPERIAIFAGGRRFKRCCALVEKKRWPCRWLKMLFAMMHPSDEFKAFHRLHKQGSSVSHIAMQHGYTTLHVERILRLAKVHRTLFKAFREDKLSMEAMMAYAFTDDTKLQKSTYDALGPGDSVHYINRALKEGLSESDSRLARYVGLEAYREAGGATRKDPFSEKVYLCYIGLLQQRATEKLERSAERLRGWGWVEATLTQSYDSHITRIEQYPVNVPPEVTDEHERLQALVADHHENNKPWDEAFRETSKALRAIERTIEKKHSEFLPDEKALAGCIVSISRDGKTQIDRGLVKKGRPCCFEAIAKHWQSTGEALAKHWRSTGEAEDGAAEKPAVKSGLSARFTQDLGLIRHGVIRQHIAEQPENAALVLHFQIVVTHLRTRKERCNRSAKLLTLRGDCPDDTTSVEQKASTMTDAMSEDDSDTNETGDVSTDEQDETPPRFEWIESDDEIERFEGFRAVDESERSALLAEAVAALLERGKSVNRGNALIDHLCRTRLLLDVASRWRPTAENYFKRLTKAQLLALLPVFWNDDIAAHHSNDKKAVLVERCHLFFHDPADRLSDA